MEFGTQKPLREFSNRIKYQMHEKWHHQWIAWMNVCYACSIEKRAWTYRPYRVYVLSARHDEKVSENVYIELVPSENEGNEFQMYQLKTRANRVKNTEKKSEKWPFLDVSTHLYEKYKKPRDSFVVMRHAIYLHLCSLLPWWLTGSAAAAINVPSQICTRNSLWLLRWCTQIVRACELVRRCAATHSTRFVYRGRLHNKFRFYLFCFLQILFPMTL